MRLLPTGPDHERRGAPGYEPPPRRRADRRCNARQHLPLRHLSTHPRSNPQGGRELSMSIIYRVTRRDFLRDTGLGAGALVFGCYLSTDNLLGADLSKLKEILHNHVTLSPFVAIKPK